MRRGLTFRPWPSLHKCHYRYCAKRRRQPLPPTSPQTRVLASSGDEFADFPYAGPAPPRLTPNQRRRRLLAFTLTVVAMGLGYATFVLRCVQNGRVLGASGDATADKVCLGGVLSACGLLLLCLIMQLIEYRHRCCRLLCCCCCRRRHDDDPFGFVQGRRSPAPSEVTAASIAAAPAADA